MNIEVKGNSGCDIEIKEENNSLYVYKTTNDANYTNRLLLQGEKQKNAVTTETIVVPTVYTNEPNCIKMDYVYAKNFIDFFERSQFSDIESFVQSIIDYIDIEINKSELQSVGNAVFLKKFTSIAQNCEKNELTNTDEIKKLLQKAQHIFEKNTCITIPIGVCHGDLTFSNIMFANSKYYLIDFLDSFIETPLQDIVKIRQDSSLKWSILMYCKKYDDIRVNMIFDYIDKKIDTYFKKYSFYTSCYSILQLMNILRILPYAKNETVVHYLIDTLNTLIKTFDK